MPEFESSFYTGAIDGQPQTKLDGRLFNASLVSYTVEWTGDAAQNDTLKLFKVFSTFRPLMLIVDHTAFGSSVVLDIGDNAGTPDPDRFYDGLDIAAAGRSVLPVANAGQGILANGEEIVATFLGANPAAGTLKVTVIGSTI